MTDKPNRLGITPGDWSVEAGAGRVESLATGESVACAYADVGVEQADANADLIADAGTTANRTGLLPSDLHRAALRPGWYTCPYCSELSGFDADDIHSGCTFYCEHCGQASVIEPVRLEAHTKRYGADERIAELEAENKLLRGIVIDAYREGYTDGHITPCAEPSSVDDDWQHSDTQAKLEALDKLNPPARGT